MNPVLEIIQFCTRDFWTLIASIMLIAAFSSGVFSAVRALTK